MEYPIEAITIALLCVGVTCSLLRLVTVALNNLSEL